jgi:hypothetical protein
LIPPEAAADLRGSRLHASPVPKFSPPPAPRGTLAFRIITDVSAISVHRTTEIAAGLRILCVNNEYLHNSSVLSSYSEKDGEYGLELRP